jgi:cytochrome P450
LGIGLDRLLAAPDQWEALCARPDLAANAVEELLRLITPVQWLTRTAVRDCVIDGLVVPAGSRVLPIVAAANRDPNVFDDPARLDIARPEARQHLSLGFGIHFCLGASLARLEGETVLRSLAARFPAIVVVDRDPRWGGSPVMRKQQRMVVRNLTA